MESNPEMIGERKDWTDTTEFNSLKLGWNQGRNVEIVGHRNNVHNINDNTNNNNNNNSNNIENAIAQSSSAKTFLRLGKRRFKGRSFWGFFLSVRFGAAPPKRPSKVISFQNPRTASLASLASRASRPRISGIRPSRPNATRVSQYHVKILTTFHMRDSRDDAKNP